MMGIAYTLVAAIAWSCAPFLVPDSGVGTSMGLLTSFQMFGVGISNALLGVLLSQEQGQMQKWENVMWFLGSCACVGLTFAVGLNVLDWKSGGNLRYSQAEREKMRGITSSSASRSSDKSYLVDTDSLSYGSQEESP